MKTTSARLPGRILTLAQGAILALAPAIVQAQPAPPPPPPPPASSGETMKVFAMGGGTFLGVGVRDIDAERAKSLKLKEEYGVEVTHVEDDSPAAKAGLKLGDTVLEYNGQRVEGTTQFIRFVRETPPGRTVKLTVSRGGSNQTVAATLATRKAMAYGMPGMGENWRIEMPKFEMAMPDIPKAMMSWRSAVLGIDAESLGDSQLAAYFGVKEGVLVRSVMKNTAAEKAGIKAGDVLLKVDESKVLAPRDVTQAIRTARKGSKNSLPVSLMREKREMTLTVTLEDETSERTPTPRSQRVTVKQML